MNKIRQWLAGLGVAGVLLVTLVFAFTIAIWLFLVGLVAFVIARLFFWKKIKAMMQQGQPMRRETRTSDSHVVEVEYTVVDESRKKDDSPWRDQP